MDIGALGSTLTDQSLGSLQGQVGLAVIKQANALAGEEVAQLLQALPQAATPIAPGEPGALINTWA